MATRTMRARLPDRVIDTSAWIELAIGSDTGRQVQAALPARERCVVPTIVQLELAKWLARERSEDEADRMIAYLQKCRVVPLETRLALRAAEICRQHRLATADAVIYATAQEAGAELLTCDAHFEGLPGVVYLAKSGQV
jgi:predicted nucleic acid-binding protein